MALPAEEEKPGVPEWIVTYGDLMSLLLTFFVLLAAFSELKTEEQRIAVLESILKQFGDIETIAEFTQSQQFNRTTRPKGKVVDPQGPLSSDSDHSSAGDTAVAGRSLAVRTLREGQRRIIGRPIMFSPGLAELSNGAVEGLQEAAESLRGKRHLIDIEGFKVTGELPALSPFTTPADLAYARGRAVADFLVEKGGILRDLVRISVTAPAEARGLTVDEMKSVDFDRVVITTLESTTAQYERTATPDP